MQIKLNTVMCGPRGNHGIGCVLTVGKDIDKESADILIETGQAEEVKAVQAKKTMVADEPVKETLEETADEPIEESEITEEAPVHRKGKGKKPRGN